MNINIEIEIIFKEKHKSPITVLIDNHHIRVTGEPDRGAYAGLLATFFLQKLLTEKEKTETVEPYYAEWIFNDLRQGIKKETEENFK